MRKTFPRPHISLWLILTLIGCGACSEASEKNMLASKYRKLVPLHKKLPPPGPSDWLANHREPGQTFRQYISSRPVRPDARRKVIYIQPLGEFTKTERKILTQTAEYMQLYFGLKVTVQKDLPLSIIPDRAKRKHPSWGMDQVLAPHVLDKVLIPRLPRDAMASIALTTSDLWPGEGWNFVFGLASLEDRVGVWSIYRNGDPHKDEASYRLCLKRTIKTATHETGHMFSMRHCIAYQCNMCGSNHREESDRHPLWLCPHCLAKLCWATKTDPVKRIEKLSKFCDENGLDTERAFFEKSLDRFKE